MALYNKQIPFLFALIYVFWRGNSILVNRILKRVKGNLLWKPFFKFVWIYIYMTKTEKNTLMYFEICFQFKFVRDKALLLLHQNFWVMSKRIGISFMQYTYTQKKNIPQYLIMIQNSLFWYASSKLLSFSWMNWQKTRTSKEN